LEFEDRDGNVHVDEQTLEVPVTSNPNHYVGEAARKSVLIVRYGKLYLNLLLALNIEFKDVRRLCYMKAKNTIVSAKFSSHTICNKADILYAGISQKIYNLCLTTVLLVA
jgi:hypothetical protein